MNKRPIREVGLKAFIALNQDQKNRQLLDWLSDEDRRQELFALVNGQHGSMKGRLKFPSRDASPRECDCKGVNKPLKPPGVQHKEVELITDRELIIKILKDDGTRYSNRIYAELGGGSFMLALDPKTAMAHPEQRAVFFSCFPNRQDQLVDLSHRACQAASITALRAADFDLAVFAEQSALRFCQKLMGYSFSDYRLLDTSLRASYRALVYQVLGRHFVTDPVVIPEGKVAMAKLLTRTSALIDAYAQNKPGFDQEDALKGCNDSDVPLGFTPVLKQLGTHLSDMNAEQRAIIALGSVIGTVGNVQAAACIAVKGIFDDQIAGNGLWLRARSLAKCQPRGALTIKQFEDWKALIQDLLRKNPPIPFLPRLVVGKNGNATLDSNRKHNVELILALGGGTADSSGDDPLIWGMSPPPRCAHYQVGTHWCAGQALAWPLIVEIVRQVMMLPGLEQRLDPQDATVIGLKKRWGFACESYPLTHRRDSRVNQSCLNVAMRLKSPVRDNADRVREVIRSGAPRIEQALRESRHVHFAWFELIDSDSTLVLHTVYDGSFEAYIQDFALKVGDLFDQLFECIEDPPPMPVDKFPNEFVALIQRFNRPPTMGYFFTAYPGSDTARIIRDELARP
jgi:hypothetical protein